MNFTQYAATLRTTLKEHQRQVTALLSATRQAKAGNLPVLNADGTWTLRSQKETNVYTIGPDGCNCKAAQEHKLCWHRVSVNAAKAVMAAEYALTRDYTQLEHCETPSEIAGWFRGEGGG